MTLPAALSIISASIGLFAALVALGMSSAPGRLDLRWFALCAACAALFNLSNFPATLGVPSETVVLAARLSSLFSSLHAAAWFKYYAAQEQRPMRGWERAIAGGGLLIGALSVIPGVVFSPDTYPRSVPGFDVIYVAPVPTRFGLVAIAYDDVGLAILLARYVWRRARGEREITAQTIALAAVLGGATHDALASAGVLRGPYFLDLSMLVLVVAVGGSLARSFVANARALEVSMHELANANEELVRKERLAAVGELAAVVAQAVWTPLAVVFDAVAALREPGAERDALVTTIQREAERLRDIVSDLLEFARPRPPVFAPAAIEELVRAAVDAACNAVGTWDVTIDAEPAPATCDERLVRRAVLNIVTNALQARDRKGPVVVTVRTERDDILVAVEDDGAGVAAEDRERIFTPFFSKRPTGTGLGLAVVRTSAEAHAGSVTLSDTPDGGATFTLRFPRQPPG